MELDLSDLKSVRSFAKSFKEKFGRLDVLVNNGESASVYLSSWKSMCCGGDAPCNRCFAFELGRVVI